MSEGAVIVAVVIGFPMLVGSLSIFLRHREKIAAIRAQVDAGRPDMETLRSEYHDFVLGADARMQRLEDRLRTLETKSRTSGDDGEVQNIHRS